MAVQSAAMNGIFLRLAVRSDFERLRTISKGARGRYRSISSLAHIADSPALALSRFELCRITVAVNTDDGVIVGFAMTRILDNFLYLDNISSDAGASGRGVGSRLLSDVIAYGRTIGVSALTLTTFRAPQWNGPWFRRNGFDTMPPNEVGRGLTEVLERQSEAFDPSTRETLWLCF